MTFCQHPDRDVPKIKCGYPLPCPWHTLIIEPGSVALPATVTVPTTANVGIVGELRVRQIAAAFDVEPKRKTRKRVRRR
jgi:hypothetical protein